MQWKSSGDIQQKTFHCYLFIQKMRHGLTVISGNILDSGECNILQEIRSVSLLFLKTPFLCLNYFQRHNLQISCLLWLGFQSMCIWGSVATNILPERSMWIDMAQILGRELDDLTFTFSLRCCWDCVNIMPEANWKYRRCHAICPVFRQRPYYLWLCM